MRQTTMSGVSVYRDPRFLLWLALVTLLAAAIREHFVLATIVDHPFVGDVRQYVFYAWNLVHHGVFSLAPPQIAAPPPDAYRSPGYPWLISLCMMLRPNGDWYALMLQAQVLLGTATVALTGMLGRLWLPRWAALWAAALLAFWPHHVAATGALLSEVLFGFTLIAALLLYARGRMPAAGAMFGFSYLVNPLIGLFPIVLALLHKRDFDRRKLVLLLGVFLLPVAALAIRNATIASTPNQQPGRLATNLVQGSWPLYHAAQNDAHLGKAVPMAIMRDIDEEVGLLDANPAAELTAIRKADWRATRCVSDLVHLGQTKAALGFGHTRRHRRAVCPGRAQFASRKGTVFARHHPRISGDQPLLYILGILRNIDHCSRGFAPTRKKFSNGGRRCHGSIGHLPDRTACRPAVRTALCKCLSGYRGLVDRYRRGRPGDGHTCDITDMAASYSTYRLATPAKAAMTG